ncbi:type IV secretion system DNA-binding domain-containing protein [Clavibacter michiganensis]|uniref:type IV secretion system DNA-binding domain-containing protein n=1 Tax=Clavibacter michiganensis TaxID=28447 RepID=UPI0009CA547D|nr:type IV secretion system DNA-binding domain-containing protein [Clavibacter michiganensis]MBF4639346.1 type IV secretion system DNA-binding domain-containing protein [Clavibacter michiganensis subsp. michiganensis]MDO4027088.1 type IV secretion system DNA-binding domain-containing protein [Clavibacter michiganensis]MDO4036493.1 type IV secretion system DNA-binding domain-containing protein [Clavibacter michiganensis]MDO4048678.1 type IV secretion system DNA-binding domain-containing protein 
MSPKNDSGNKPETDWKDVRNKLVRLAVILVGFGVVPVVVNWLTPAVLPIKARYWTVPRWWVRTVTACTLLVAAVVAWELAHVSGWVAARLGSDDGPAQWLGHYVPVWVVNVVVGALLIPAGWAWKRRRLARAVSRRQIDDVTMQEDIEKARTQAADLAAASRIGVKLDIESHEVVGLTNSPVYGPHTLDSGRVAVGAVIRATVRSVQERMRDRTRVRQWQERGNTWVTVPEKAGQVRLIVIAESGQGKTVLLFQIMLALLQQNFRVVFLDGKGNPRDAAKLRAAAEAAGHTTHAPATWNLFNGTSAEITDRITRLFPQTEGEGSFYRKRAREVMQKLQRQSPVASLDDLRARAHNPAKYVSDRYDLAALRDTSGPVKNNPPAAQAALHDIEVHYEDLRPLISEDGWSFDELAADLTTVTITPSDNAQKQLADLLLLAFRQHITRRAASGDESPLVVIIDEFAQLGGVDVDPAEFVASVQETGRSLGVGLIAATQSVAGMSSDAMMQTRLMSSGAGIVIGRTNDPEEAVKYAGTIMRMEASGAASGDQLGTARAQHTYTLHPQTVRQAADGMFWLVQNGAVVPFRALPPTAEPTNANRPTEKDTGERTAEVDVQGDVSATSTVLTGEADGWEAAATSAAPEPISDTITPPPSSATPTQEADGWEHSSTEEGMPAVLVAASPEPPAGIRLRKSDPR